MNVDADLRAGYRLVFVEILTSPQYLLWVDSGVLVASGYMSAFGQKRTFN
jgi:hypothetical protein